ncbi:DUF7527 domain-containing protein [Natrarchaeobaculum aegyptiacum]|uniref:Transcriptional regulator n=1 Tax=Natrarchaeobaculum aegyptiacum TaxID=745377 RepID=A0A2Z2HVS3_9EURY|nr:transcriptional regulator [Natrarchaeobaculum aegyptiacum]ARS90883.1 transcriptional regulator [Natrarchaeobaculum aegyptiacum]
MDSRTQERVEQWDSRPFSGGYDGLSDLTAKGFSGAVTAAGTWLFVLNGRIVGVFGGDLEDFEAASGTVYEAPHPSLPLLFSMKSQGGDTRAKYYTNDTSLEEVDQTLQDGSFTGYVELSENVLSGDYYAVYYGGRRMAAAFIGNAERLQTGDEAFERAADEVGIYEVVDVDVEVTDVPSDDPAANDSDDASDSEPPAGTGGVDPSSEAGGEPGDAVDATGVSSSASLDDDPAGITATEPTPDDDPSGITASSPADVDPADEPTARSSDRRDDPGLTVSTTDSEPAEAGSTDSTLDPEEVEAAAAELEQSDISWTDDDVDEPASSVGDDASEEADEDAGLEERFEEEEQWRETRSIPSIDPEMTTQTGDDGSSSRASGSTPSQGGQTMARRQPNSGQRSAAGASRSQSQGRAQTQSQSQTQSHRQARADQQPSRPTGDARSSPRTTGAGAGTTSQSPQQSAGDAEGPIRDRLESLEEQRAELATKAERLEAERDRLEAENEELTDRVEELTARIDDLESRLESDGAAGGAQAASQRLAPERALSGTNLFVRYASKSEPTLLTAHDGAADRAEVAGNLHLEHHTEFDDGDVAVDGQPYEQFLTGTLVYQFVDWLTAVLLYEIRDTGQADRLGDLYDAIPRIDRAEINGSVSLADDDTEDVPENVSFDVVAYDKMGNPLLVVTVNDSREPASEDLLRGFEEAASAVKANYPDLAAAIAVTSSYFEPGALEVTEQATSSGFLSRSSKASYVNVSRKQGYHLCLVESQSEGFHMTVPEL